MEAPQGKQPHGAAIALFGPRRERMVVEDARKSARRYVADEDTMRSLDAWMISQYARPDIFVVAPPVRDVGEQQLIEELAQASYRLSGRHDAKRRHFLERPFLSHAPLEEYQRFLDEAFATSEITDEFYGVDNIDLTSWVGEDIGLLAEAWAYLVTHVNAHPETDFVFCVYTDEVEAARNIARRIVCDTGLALEWVELSYPGASSLAEAFHEASLGEFTELADRVLCWFESRGEHDGRMNYGFARSCAGYALHRLSISDDRQLALDEAFERYQNLPSPVVKARPYGFI